MKKDNKKWLHPKNTPDKMGKKDTKGKSAYPSSEDIHRTEKEENDKENLETKTPEELKKESPGYPTYPASEDIYSQNKEESALDPEDVSKTKTPNEKPGTRNEKDFEEDKSGDDLDVPGSELDDEQEKIGNEDEENNYYSLGGDNHNNLDENNG